jgi:hypothetical protein
LHWRLDKNNLHFKSVKVWTLSDKPCSRAQTSPAINSLFYAAILKIKKVKIVYYHKQTEHGHIQLNGTYL